MQRVSTTIQSVYASILIIKTREELSSSLVYFCLFSGAGLALLIPRLTGQAIDLVLSSSDRHTLLLIALGVAGAGLLRCIISYWQSYMSEYLSQRVAYDIRSLFYNRLQRLSYSFHDRSQTGQLMSRATADVEGVRMFVGFALLRGVYFLVLMIAITAVLLSLDWKLALISLSVIPFISFRTVVINRKLRVLWMKIQQGLGVLGTRAWVLLLPALLARPGRAVLPVRRPLTRYALQHRIRPRAAARDSWNRLAANTLRRS